MLYICWCHLFFIIRIRWRRKGQEVFATAIVVAPFLLVFSCCHGGNKMDLELPRSSKEDVAPFLLVFSSCHSGNKMDLELSRSLKEDETKQ